MFVVDVVFLVDTQEWVFVFIVNIQGWVFVFVVDTQVWSVCVCSGYTSAGCLCL